MNKLMDRLIGFRIDAKAASWFTDFQNDRRIKNQSLAARQVFVLGLQAHRLIVGKDTKLGSDLELETIIDQMTTEQKERLLELLIQKLGIKEVSRLRELAALK